MRIINLTQETKNDITAQLLKRSPSSYGEYEAKVQAILEDVKSRKDAAVFEYTEKFDKIKLTKTSFRVTEEEIAEAYGCISEEMLRIIRTAAENIEDFHRKQLRNSWIDTRADGSILGQRVTPLSAVGVYVPGGKAAYPSSVLMNIIPAKVAGVERITMMTPVGPDGKVYPATLVAAKEAGVTEIFKAGGAQAIAALAYGTESVKKVDKIVV